MQDLHSNTQACVDTFGKPKKFFLDDRRKRQGCILPDLNFIITVELIMRNSPRWECHVCLKITFSYTADVIDFADDIMFYSQDTNISRKKGFNCRNAEKTDCR